MLQNAFTVAVGPQTASLGMIPDRWGGGIDAPELHCEEAVICVRIVYIIVLSYEELVTQ